MAPKARSLMNEFVEEAETTHFEEKDRVLNVIER